jgi:uncharacterized protein (DUF58 family)
MQGSDIQKLGARERHVLELSFQPKLSEKRIRNIALLTLMAVVGLALFTIYGASVGAIAALAFVVLLVSAVEKISYSREMMEYKSLVRALVHRIEALEGVEPTPTEGHPAAHARKQDERAHAHA